MKTLELGAFWGGGEKPPALESLPYARKRETEGVAEGRAAERATRRAEKAVATKVVRLTAGTARRTEVRRAEAMVGRCRNERGRAGGEAGG
jgi:hypothetical protein